MRKGSIKSTRINAEVQRELANIIRGELKDPRVDPMTSVTACDVTTDLKQCKVYISILSPDEEVHKSTMEGLKAAKGFLRKRLAETVNLRNTPEIILIEDRGIAYGMYMSKLIDDVAAKDRSASEKRGEATENEEKQDENQ